MAKVMRILTEQGQLIEERDPLGFSTYTLSMSKVMNKKTRTKPFTPNQILGAYVNDGNIIIKLSRRANARSLTLSSKDLALIASLTQGIQSN